MNHGNISLTWRLIAGHSKAGEAHSLLRAWQGWEHFSRYLWPPMSIPGAPNGVLRIRIGSYDEAPIILPDGTEIRPNATIARIHCDNEAIVRMVGIHRNPFAAGREDLRSLAIWAQNDSIGRRIEAFYARSILTKGACRLGFTVTDSRVTMHRRFERVFFKGLLLLYSPEGLNRLRHGSTPRANPADLWLSRHALINRYSPDCICQDAEFGRLCRPSGGHSRSERAASAGGRSPLSAGDAGALSRRPAPSRRT